MNVLYLRTDFWFGLKAGGSVAHTAGVILGLKAAGCRVSVISTDALAGVGDTPVEVVPPWPLLRRPKVRVLGPFAYGWQVKAAAARLADERFDLVYHRHADMSCAGPLAAGRLRVPLVMEVNHLVVPWARESGGGAYALAPLSARIESFVFRRARLLVAISDVVRDQLLAAGVPASRVIVSPNGVDAEVFRPDVDGGEVRRRFHLEGRPVVGFIGTFGHWHGVETLAQAIPSVLSEHPAARFLLIGDGPLRSTVEARLRESGAAGAATFTGLIPYDQAPEHLAACDVLVSPHAPARTGRFIGSPTKLFEYMAMGRGIVASDLEQIGQVLEHDRTALLVPPADAPALARAISALLASPERSHRLGQEARRVVQERYTWAHGARRVLSALQAVS